MPEAPPRTAAWGALGATDRLRRAPNIGIDPVGPAPLVRPDLVRRGRPGNPASAVELLHDDVVRPPFTWISAEAMLAGLGDGA